MTRPVTGGRASRHWLWLLLLPFIGVLWVPFYNKSEPQLWDFPFFYWYQLAWVLISAVITALVYVKTKSLYKPDPLARRDGGAR
ncbi:MAG: DUF3311 domain-containing protein [Janthinobacterium lividum]